MKTSPMFSPKNASNVDLTFANDDKKSWDLPEDDIDEFNEEEHLPE